MEQTYHQERSREASLEQTTWEVWEDGFLCECGVFTPVGGYGHVGPPEKHKKTKAKRIKDIEQILAKITALEKKVLELERTEHKKEMRRNMVTRFNRRVLDFYNAYYVQYDEWPTMKHAAEALGKTPSVIHFHVEKLRVAGHHMPERTKHGVTEFTDSKITIK